MSDKLKLLSEILLPNRTVRLVGTDIYSVIDGSHHKSQYDKKVKLYDLFVGSRLYNRVMWGTSTGNYRSFASQATNSMGGRLLDVGCGSLLFTWRAYEHTDRPIVACDVSLDMLRQARARLSKSRSGIHDHVLLLQADIWDLPFRNHSFETVLNMNVLHHFADARTLLSRLVDLLTVDGHLYLTTLVTNNRLIGNYYLRLLHQCGWLAKPWTSQKLKTLLQDEL